MTFEKKDCSNDSTPSKFLNLVDFETYFKSLNHLRLVREVNKIIARKDKEFVEHYFDTYDKSVIVKDGE